MNRGPYVSRTTKSGRTQTVAVPKTRIIRKPGRFVQSLWRSWKRCHQMWRKYPDLEPAAIGFAFYCAMNELFEGKRPDQEPDGWMQDPSFWKSKRPTVGRIARVVRKD